MSDKIENNTNLYMAILEVYKKVGYVQKTGEMAGYGAGYKYAGESDLINAIRPELVKNGILFNCHEISEIETREVRKEDKYGKIAVSFHFSAKFTFVFTHAETGERLFVKAMGKGVDNGDKAEYKAMTGALKYALRQTFVIETGDDPDKPESDAEKKEREQGYIDFISKAKTVQELTDFYKANSPLSQNIIEAMGAKKKEILQKEKQNENS